MNIDKVLNESIDEIQNNWKRYEIKDSERKKVIDLFGSIRKIENMTSEKIIDKLISNIEELEYEDIEDISNALLDMKKISKEQAENVVDKAEDFANGGQGEFTKNFKPKATIKSKYKSLKNRIKKNI